MVLFLIIFSYKKGKIHNRFLILRQNLIAFFFGKKKKKRGNWHTTGLWYSRTFLQSFVRASNGTYALLK